MHQSHQNDVDNRSNETCTCYTQMSAKKGIKMFGNSALKALMEEYRQLDKLEVLKPLDIKQLTKYQKIGTLNAIDLIKQKRCGKIKGRAVADGRKQRDLYSKHEVLSPALSLESFLAILGSRLSSREACSHGRYSRSLFKG